MYRAMLSILILPEATQRSLNLHSLNVKATLFIFYLYNNYGIVKFLLRK